MIKSVCGSTFLLFVLGLSTTTSAAYITDFNKTTNDGVFTITPQQAAYLGTPTADRVGFYRIRDGSGTVLNPGDTFDANSILNSTNSDASILGIFNGNNADLTYTGDFYKPLGITTIGPGTSYYRGVMFSFSSSAGNIVFDGTSTFNAAQTQGDADFLPVPEPTAVTLLLCVGASAFLRRR